jgi:peptidoglycan hydrolase-like protein with peptidoglycan-binding domain
MALASASERKALHVLGLIASLNRPRLLGVSVLIAAVAGIAANALLLQSMPHPEPLILTRETAETDSPTGDPLVLAIQAALRGAGYYAGRLDGVAGPDLAAAIRTFEERTGLSSTGASDAEFLGVIRSAPGHNEERAATHDQEGPPSQQADSTVAVVQGALARAAYGPLRADGVVGPQTRDAIIRFQRDHGLAASGEITDTLLVELRAAGALEDE